MDFQTQLPWVDVRKFGAIQSDPADPRFQNDHLFRERIATKNHDAIQAAVNFAGTFQPNAHHWSEANTEIGRASVGKECRL